MTSGVYIMRNDEGRVLYVGASRTLQRRITEHAEKDWWQTVTTIELRHTEDRAAAFALEADLIRSLAPLHNTVRHVGSPEKRPRVAPPTIPLAAVRGALGMRQPEVCATVSEILGTTFTIGALSAIENGHRGASPDVMAALEIALGLRDGDLLVDYEPVPSRRAKEAS